MKKILVCFLILLSYFGISQDYDFQQLCLICAESQGFYCGDDPSNWTQYSPDGCVVNSWINDGWEDCVDASDESAEGPTLPINCLPIPPECDSIFVEVPVIEYIYETDTLELPFYIYETVLQIDTVYETEYITQIIIDTLEIETLVPEYIYVTDTVYAEVLDTMFIDVVEEVEVVVFDTIIQTEYVEFFVTDTIVEYVELIETQYIDCDTGMPCNSSISEVINKSNNNELIYNIYGQVIKSPQGLYIQNGKIKWHK
tara:strand:+ start:7615 stop:8382 length:768 start_codon:yes stop_codon:yes gene_type:complete